MDTNSDIKLVCFDIDGTLINHNSWLQLNLAMGLTEEEDQELYDQYISGRLSYDTWMERLSAFYRERGQGTKENIERVLLDYTFKDGAEEIVAYLQKKGYKVAVLTGSFHILAKDVAKKLTLDAFKGNSQILFNDNGTFEKIEADDDEIQNKPEHLKEICAQLTIELENCVCVGDGINDVGLFKLAQHGIAFNDSPKELKDLAWRTIDSLEELKNIF